MATGRRRDTTALKISLLAAFALTFPVVLFQLGAFLGPAIEQHLQRLLSGFVAVASVLFLGGAAFGYFIVLPRAITEQRVAPRVSAPRQRQPSRDGV